MKGNCNQCGSLIHKWKKYCNVECMTIHYNKNRCFSKCQVCEKLMSYPKSANKKVCSKACYNKIRLGKKRPDHSLKITGKKFPGRVLSISHMAKLSGENSPAWKGGVTIINSSIRLMPEYKNWKIKCHKRDNYSCQSCGVKKRNLECHHIIGLSKIIFDNKIKSTIDAISCNLLWDISNGQTLCKDCHIKTDNYGPKVIK